jgi:hypothetical protein
MTNFIKNGPTFRIIDENSIDIRKALPPGVYLLDVTPSGFQLIQTDQFDIKFKIYGSVMSNVGRILKTYVARPNSTGVLLAGEKGSGKTLLAKLLAQQAIKDLDAVVLIINKPYSGDAFSSLLQQIHQPCIVIFDEFEKVYDVEHQQEILTLFDGMFPTKKLFVLTVNDPYKVDSHMRNRPGRLFYFLEFDGLEEDFIREYCEDNLKNKKYIDNLCKTLILFDKFNFDMMQAIVEEMNRYNEKVQDSLRFLNIRPDVKKSIYTITGTFDGKVLQNSFRGRWAGDPLGEKQEITLYKEITNKQKKDPHFDPDDLEIDIWLSPERITKMDSKKGAFIYEFPEEKVVITLEKEKVSKFNYYDYVF